MNGSRYKDHLFQAKIRGAEYESLLTDYLANCRVSFAFRGDEFIPSPDFDLKKALEWAEKTVGRYRHAMQGKGFALP